MKYFTPELWLDFNSGDWASASKKYDRRLSAYRKHLQNILPRLPRDARRFFREVCLLHDGTLVRLETGDHIEAQTRKVVSGKAGRQAGVRMLVLTEGGEFTYALHYKEVVRVQVKFPAEAVLFPISRHANFGDWGYDELSAVTDGIFRHGILFSSGATITIDFRKFSFQKMEAQSS